MPPGVVFQTPEGEPLSYIPTQEFDEVMLAHKNTAKQLAALGLSGSVLEANDYIVTTYVDDLDKAAEDAIEASSPLYVNNGERQISENND